MAILLTADDFRLHAAPAGRSGDGRAQRLRPLAPIVNANEILSGREKDLSRLGVHAHPMP
jgi:hypothetical protein